MPRLVEGSEVSAYLSAEVASAWGLAGRKIPIAGGGGDNAASAVGVGAVEPGEGFVSLGTSGVVFSVTDKYVSLPERTLHAFCHALPNRWHGMSVMLSAAASLSWVAELLGRGDEIGALGRRRRRIRAVRATSRRRRFSCPISAANARPITTPTRRSFGRPQVPAWRRCGVYAVMEGVAFSFADAVDVLNAADARPTTPLLVGGGARSGFWGQ